MQMRPDEIPSVRIQINFQGGPYDGESAEWDNRNQTGSHVALGLYLMTNGGSVGRDGVAGGSQGMQQYRIVDRGESDDEISITVEYVGPIDPPVSAADKMMRDNEALLKVRSLILTFKKGGRIKEEHVYYSEDRDYETQFAISLILRIGCQTKDTKTGIVEFGTNMIGRRIVGVAPWQDYQTLFKRLHEYDGKKEQMPPDLKAEQMDLQTPMSISDYVELPDGTIKIFVEG
jgi:hypothetical protein